MRNLDWSIICSGIRVGFWERATMPGEDEHFVVGVYLALL